MINPGLFIVASAETERKGEPLRLTREKRELLGGEWREDLDNLLALHETEEVVRYRKISTALLRRYFHIAMHVGRVPSILGGQIFRAKVSSYRMHTFEDMVIFVHDMERCLEKLDRRSLQLIAARGLLEHTADETGRMMGITLRQVQNLYPEALDRLTAVLVASGMIRKLNTGDATQASPSVVPKKPARSARVGDLKASIQVM